MRRWMGIVFALALMACNALPASAPKAPTADLERQVAALLAPNADIVDQPFEDLLSALDLQKTYGTQAAEILDQIHKTRAAVAAARMSSSSSGRSGLASVARSVGTFSVPQFAIRFGESLDQLTKEGGTLQLPSHPYTSQETGSKSFTTTTLNVTELFTGSGAHVTATVKWSYSTITIETATGKTVEHITDERTLIGGIDVCPDASGVVPATLEVSSVIAAQDATGTTTRKSSGTSTFQGTVDDQAVLRTVAQRSHTEATTVSSTGNGGYSADQSATWSPKDSSGDYLAGSLGVGANGDAVTPSGTASVADVARSAGWDLVLNGYALQPAYKGAQDLWRHGRCVMVTALDYAAETPINTLDQEASQHDETVDRSSETKVTVNLKHRFAGGAVSAPTTATLSSGAKTITPNRIDGGSGALTYKAPDEDGKKARVQLKSISKRGIGTLVLDFHTGGEGLTLSIIGTFSQETRRIGLVQINDTVSIGPIEFKKQFDNTWEGTGTWQAQTRSFVSVAGTTQTCTGSQSGAITMAATYEDRGGKKVWVVNGLDASAGGTAQSSCPGELHPEADVAELFLATIDQFVIAEEGGRLKIHGSKGGPSGQITADGTVDAKTKK